ncbi:MAG: HNH endonuclease [Planctomycetaceae bacterium]|nr:HNH endonuclease [Planctomycetaceae bacterium]
MDRKAIPRRVRERVRARAGKRCEYCQHLDEFECTPLACEHVIPRSLGAGDTFDELAWSCIGCNGHKSNKTEEIDPHTGRVVPLFNPRRQSWRRHFRWSENYLMIEGRTATGRATIQALQLNRQVLMNLRHVLRITGHHPPTSRSRPQKPR